jgi:hypothetical protein
VATMASSETASKLVLSREDIDDDEQPATVQFGKRQKLARSISDRVLSKPPLSSPRYHLQVQARAKPGTLLAML